VKFAELATVSHNIQERTGEYPENMYITEESAAELIGDLTTSGLWSVPAGELMQAIRDRKFKLSGIRILLLLPWPRETLHTKPGPKPKTKAKAKAQTETPAGDSEQARAAMDAAREFRHKIMGGNAGRLSPEDLERVMFGLWDLPPRRG